MKRNHQKAFLSIWNAFRFWQGFVYWKRTSSSAWSPSRGVGWSFWKVACLPWLILGSGTRNSSVQISQSVGEALVQSSINIWQELKRPPMKGAVCCYGLSVLCPPKSTGWRPDVRWDGIWRWRLRVHHERAVLVKGMHVPWEDERGHVSLSRVKTVRGEWGRQPSADTKCAGTLIVDFPASGTLQNKCLWLKAPGLWYPFKQCNSAKTGVVNGADFTGWKVREKILRVWLRGPFPSLLGSQIGTFKLCKWLKCWPLMVSHPRCYFLWHQNHCGWWVQSWNEKMLALWKGSYDKPR